MEQEINLQAETFSALKVLEARLNLEGNDPITNEANAVVKEALGKLYGVIGTLLAAVDLLLEDDDYEDLNLDGVEFR